MTDRIQQYVDALKLQHSSGHATEHTYRPALERLMAALPDTIAKNDPKRSAHGNPDFVFLKSSNPGIIRGYAEAKDIVVDLNKSETSEQLTRYAGYDNLFLTNYLDFRFFKNGDKYQSIVIGEIKDGRLELKPENFAQLESELKAFLELPPEQIRSGKRLAEIMGAKAIRIRTNVKLYLSQQDERNAELEKIYEVMRELLVHDLTPEQFADMYAQTLVYGLFVARYSDRTQADFTRKEARDLVPASNPFLREFFDHIVGPRFDARLSYIVDELCEVFSVSDVRTLVQRHLRLFEVEDEKDPIIHFYEDFLKAYDPAQRKRMGAYYTPIPVVRFIVRQVDETLKKEFGLPQGLADTSKKDFVVTTQGVKSKVPLHRVQILDPAVGTATFLNEIILTIQNSLQGQEGRWPSYVEEDLLPRLYGFELMMAPYTIAHLKLGMTLQESGAGALKKRLGVYLTNTLEEGIKKQPDLFSFGLAEAITNEAVAAGQIKHERPIMVIVGNPPYSGVSSNETEYANDLIVKYKVEPGGQQKLQERKHWLNDDYVKFIAFAEEMIAKNGTGIVAMITNHGYLDNPTFRGMRWHLGQTFDTIYVLDLHGNAKKKEVSPDGSKDENVFDIQQGVAILVAVKTGKKRGTLARVLHADLYGARRAKFEKLKEEPNWKELTLDPKMLYFVPKSTKGRGEYERGISLADLFITYNTGIVTMGDNFIVADDPETLRIRIERLINGEMTEDQLNQEFGLGKNYAKWVLANRSSISFDPAKIVRLAYRPFDLRYTYFDNKLVWRHRENVMQHLLRSPNVALLTKRQSKQEFSYVFLVNKIAESCMFESAYANNTVCPLYLYHDDGTRTPNLEAEALKQLTTNLTRAYEPEQILDYIYAVLHSPKYRQKYTEFLKTDFPRIPIPENDEQFSRLTDLGQQLRELHLLESSQLNTLDTAYPVAGSNEVQKVEFVDSKVWINGQQYFGNVPEFAWNFYIGGYQPAQKWLKDRKGRQLSSDDIVHYQKVIKALTETDRIMREIDQISDC